MPFIQSKTLLLINFVIALIHPILSVQLDVPSVNIQHHTSTSNLKQSTLKHYKKTVDTKGQFTITQGSSNHQCESYDWIKEASAAESKEENANVMENYAKDSRSCNKINLSLPSVQMVEGHFIHYENNDSDEHLFDREDFQKVEAN